MLNVHSVEIQGELAYLTIIVPEPLLCQFQDFLSSTLSISRYIKSQIRVKQAIQKTRDLTFQEDQQKSYEQYSARILSKFDTFIKTGSTPRQAIRSTRDHFNKHGNVVTCYTIELIVREAGRLSKQKTKGVSDAKEIDR